MTIHRRLHLFALLLVMLALPAIASAQVSLAAETTKVIGTINIAAGQSLSITGALPAGTNVIGHVILDSGTNVIGHVIVDSGTITTVFDSELPAAAAAADNMANPTAPFVLSGNMCFDGSTWDRCSVSDGGAGAVTANTNRTVAATDSPEVVSLALLDDSQTGDSVSYHTSVGVTEDETQIKATAGRIFSVAITNTNASVRYWRCYNLTAASTTPGTSTVFLGLAVPGSTTGGGFTHTFGPNGVAFSVALTCTLTTGAADTDVSEVAADEMKWDISYK